MINPRPMGTFKELQNNERVSAFYFNEENAWATFPENLWEKLEKNKAMSGYWPDSDFRQKFTRVANA